MNETKSKIFYTSLELFAEHGTRTVTLGDIADVVRIKKPSIYNHFENKEMLIKEILQLFCDAAKEFIDELSERNEKAETFEEVMDNIFHEQFLSPENPIGFFGLAIVIKEQHNLEYAKKCVIDLFYGYIVDHFKESFDRMIEKGMIPPSDTQMIAWIVAFGILEINDMRLHQHMGNQLPTDCKKMYDGMRRHISFLLQNGSSG